jgi:hypothetical protein
MRPAARWERDGADCVDDGVLDSKLMRQGVMSAAFWTAQHR